ncbi:MAG: hypothetical protein J3Q66DRAFT_414035 [Benniella sp.]|nr:MAG: hypothetical protein J3Q66DRAFT_414035 [Benniella sp.]
MMDVPNRILCIARPLTLNVGFILLAVIAAWFIKMPPTLQQITMQDFTTYWDCSDQSEISEESSFDGLFNNRGSWLNGTGGDGAGGSKVGYLPGIRKSSVESLDESKGIALKESHTGYMGVKFQNRYLPLLASWCMRRVILFPADKYFTAFEPGKPEAGRTFSYRSVSIRSREPSRYILQVTGCGRYNFLLQVKDEECLVHWLSLFENEQGSNFTSSGIGRSNTFSSMGNLPVNLAQTRGNSNCSDILSRSKKQSGGDEGCYFSSTMREYS